MKASGAAASSSLEYGTKLGGQIAVNAVPLEGVNWVDAMGSTHESGRPECLAPGTSREVKFAAVAVTIEGRTWRPVVWVSCQ